MTDEDRGKLIVQLMRHESVELKPYTDSVGKLTIGCGRNLTDKGISHDEAMFLLENDLNSTLADCGTFPWFAGLDPVRQRVVADMAFNLGLPKLRRFRQTLAAVARGDYGAAAAGMLDSQWAKQVGQRATRLAEMMRSGREPV